MQSMLIYWGTSWLTRRPVSRRGESSAGYGGVKSHCTRLPMPTRTTKGRAMRSANDLAFRSGVEKLMPTRWSGQARSWRGCPGTGFRARSAHHGWDPLIRWRDGCAKGTKLGRSR